MRCWKIIKKRFWLSNELEIKSSISFLRLLQINGTCLIQIKIFQPRYHFPLINTQIHSGSLSVENSTWEAERKTMNIFFLPITLFSQYWLLIEFQKKNFKYEQTYRQTKIWPFHTFIRLTKLSHNREEKFIIPH